MDDVEIKVPEKEDMQVRALAHEYLKLSKSNPAYSIRKKEIIEKLSNLRDTAIRKRNYFAYRGER